MVFGTRFAAFKGRRELHLHVVTLLLVLWDYRFVLICFENKFRSCAPGASVLWHISILLMNSFNYTEVTTSIFSMQAMTPEDTPDSSNHQFLSICSVFGESRRRSSASLQ